MSVPTKAEISQIQRRLKALNYDLGSSGPNRDGVDGEWGPRTRAGLFQHIGIVTPAPPPPPPIGRARLPKAYAWLNDLDYLPRVITVGLELLGTLETPGSANNPKILEWAAETGLKATYTADSIPWCGLYIAVVCKRAGRPVVSQPLWALNWAKWEEEAGQPILGDLLVFTRTGGGHVAWYIGEDPEYFHVLGGNQSDAVTITRIAKARLYAVRRPRYINRPDTAKPYFLAATGTISRNEA